MRLVGIGIIVGIDIIDIKTLGVVCLELRGCTLGVVFPEFTRCVMLLDSIFVYSSTRGRVGPGPASREDISTECAFACL